MMAALLESKGAPPISQLARWCAPTYAASRNPATSWTSAPQPWGVGLVLKERHHTLSEKSHVLRTPSMDPLSVTASIIAIVQLTSVIIGCLNDLKGTSKDRAQCAIEISNVSNLLVQLMYRLNEGSSNDSSYAAVEALAAAEGPIDQYRSALEQLKSKFTSTASSGLKIGSALSWKFSKEEVANILSRIERLKSLTQIALEMDHFKLSQEIKNNTAASTSGVKSMQESQDSEQYRATMDWLSSTNFPAQQSDIISKRQEGTGNWFLESPEFSKFLQGVKQTLFCPGIPGAGKTMISAIAVDHICKAFQGDNVGVAYIYNNYNRQEEQTATKMVAAILKQLVQGRPLYGEVVTALYKQHANSGTRPSHEEICTALNSVLHSYFKVYVIIDALDEYTDSDSMRSELITIIRTGQTSTNTSLMVTSRFNSGTEKLFQGTPELEIQASEADVKEYVIGRLDRFPKCVRNDPGLQAEIQDGIVLAVDRMLGLKNLPRGSTAVNKTYDKAIRRIERQPLKRSKRAKTALSWITYAERQLTTTELCHALAVEEADSELDEDNIPDIEDITSVCAGLVEVDKKSNVIRLVHYTTQEYFKGIREAWNPKAQEEIASTCLTYLFFETFSTGHCNNDADFESMLRQNPFLDYAARYWGNHTLPVQEAIKDLALPFLRNMNQISCPAQVMLIPNHRYRDYSQMVTKDPTGIHLAVAFKLTYLLQELTCCNGDENYININTQDATGQTPLSWAAERGYDAVVELLLQQDDVVADSRDNYGQTPLSWAAERGHKAVVKLLLKQDSVIADSKDKYGQTPLSWAAKGGQKAVVELLLKRDDVIADSKDKYGQTPLSYAAIKGQEAVVELLLKRDDVIADSKDKYGRTPLSWAARTGQEAVVKLLLMQDDVITNSKDINGLTPLSFAIIDGRVAVVKLLLKQDTVLADFKDNNGLTPLSWAARLGKEAIMKLLLKKDVLADSKDNNGRTPLSWAAEEGHEAVVKLLIERDDVDANSEDKDGHTPLWWATEEIDLGLRRAERMREEVAKREATAKLITEHLAKRKEAI
ncbi:hypothetical protein V496_02442 [Pseudogymnoascus sp. VKM F-4515 (FW-2607)]|nr:hypothetical protein V496_02442 [Pseudogymnoascus sp. VKM F-4515 (FW-2607)]